MESCRLCYLKTSLPLNIFAMQQDLPVLNIITRLTDLHINENDAYPKVICSVCYQQIINIFKFQQVIVDTDLKFRHHINNDYSINNDSQKSDMKTENDRQYITNDYQKTDGTHQSIETANNNNQPDNMAAHIEHKIDVVKQNTVFEVGSSNNLNGNQEILPTVNNDNNLSTNEAAFVCNVCGKRFSYKHNFKDHLNIHTGAKPYKCNVCNKMFSANSNLKIHQTVHTKERAFECNYCGKIYKHNANLKAHLKLHQNCTDECLIDRKRFKCGICYKDFAYQRNLIIHINLHEDEEV